MNIKTFDIANIIIKEADAKFGNDYFLNEEKVNIFKEYCNAFDLMLKEFDGSAIDVFVNEENKNIIITMEVNYMSVDGNEHMFYEIAERALSFWFNHCDDDKLQISFTFPTLWN